MSQSTPRTGLSLRSLIKARGELELSLVDAEVAAPGPQDVLIRMPRPPSFTVTLGQLASSTICRFQKA